MKKILLLALFVSPLFLAGCTHEEKENIMTEEKLQKIAVVKSGLLIAKEITIYENGTHYLREKSGKKYLIKSNTVDLSRYEEQNVEVTGESTPAEDTIDVFTIQLLESNAEKRSSVFWEESLGMTLEMPGTWQRIGKNETVKYSANGVDASISVEKITAGSEKENILKKSTLTGNTIEVGGKKGWSIMNEDDTSLDIILPPSGDQKEMIVFRLTPQENVNEEKAVFYEMLLGLKWTKAPKVLAEIDTDTRCGGVAKKLCPSGFRCELTSLEKNATGMCIDANLDPDEVTSLLEERRVQEEEKSVSAEEATPDKEENVEGITNHPEEKSFVEVSMAAEKWTTYERERMQYSFAIPNSWWWRGINPSGDSLERIQIATEEVTDDNWIISIQIRRNANTSLDVGGDLLSMVVPRDNETDFLVYGQKQYKTVIEAIASSLSSF